jgi:hypothetical protein
MTDKILLNNHSDRIVRVKITNETVSIVVKDKPFGDTKAIVLTIREAKKLAKLILFVEND